MAILTKKICGRAFLFDDRPASGHESGSYEYGGKKIVQQWITVGYEHPTMGYREQDIRRWIVLGRKPYHFDENHFRSITAAADAIDRGH